MRTSRTPQSRLPFFSDWRETAALPDEPEREPAPRRAVRSKRAGALVALVGAGVAVTVALPGSVALADPSASTWYALRNCESGNNYQINTGNGHYGAYQFDLATWDSVGGSGYPYQASPAEQDARALILYRERGWQPWQCAGILGLKDDSDAGSGRISDIHVPTSGGSYGGVGGGSGGGGTSTGGAPAYPSSRSYSYGATSPVIKQLQDRMHARGFFPPGNGHYGALTRVMVTRLQSLNGLKPSGLLGPLTWKAAWTGTYYLPSRATGASVPAFPGATSLSYGANSPVIIRFQNEMRARGANLSPGTGYYGPRTRAVVLRLQRLNHIKASGLLGPLTWHAAWTGTYTRATGTGGSAAAVPRYPSTQSFRFGDTSPVVARFQDRMRARGAALSPGTGHYGPRTRTVVLRLQRQNHLTPSGLLGPLTWRAAWAGTYSG